MDDGHVAIEADDRVWGFYPTDAVGTILNPLESKGEIRHQTRSQVADQYIINYLVRPDHHYLAGRLTLNPTTSMIESATLTLPKAHVFPLHLASETATALVRILSTLRAAPPIYNLRRNNCVSVSIRAIVGAGICEADLLEKVVERPDPRLFWRSIKQLEEGRPDLVGEEEVWLVGWQDGGYQWIQTT